MAESKWKPGQLEAINWRGGELIVSASAGTGKTSVIIERAWQLVLSGRAQVDELMIATFTEDAAEQLKTRLRARLDQEMLLVTRDELRAHLREQLHRLDRAQVSTIHAFCLRVVRENYYRLGISSAVSVLAPEQATVIKHQVLDGLFEECYADGEEFGERFRDVVARYGGRRFDGALSSTILSIHNFLGSLAKPDEWVRQVRELAKGYRATDFKVMALRVWEYLKRDWLAALGNVKEDFERARQDVVRQGSAKLQAYLDTLIDVAERRRKLLAGNRHEEMLRELEASLPRSPQVRKESPEGAWWGPIKDEVDGAKDVLKTLAEEIGLALSPEGKERLRVRGVYLDVLMDLVERFNQGLIETKEAEGHLEFDDLQRLALDLLEQRDVVETYRNQFKYVLVDEYQDINELQDTLLRRIGRPDEKDPERITNLFMVGDVKQSIYRFRLAEPEIFQRLYRLATPGGDGGLGRIDLPDNFRSRREVIDAVNAVFSPILCGGSLELEYGEGSRLICGAQFPESKGSLTAELHVLERKLDGGDEASDESEFAEMEATGREAYLTARRIKDLLDGGFAVNEGGTARPAEPEDVVILLRSMRNIVGTYISMLRRVGLNAYCEQVEAFLEYPEIADVVSLLRIIDNPFQDIPLATVLRSSLVGASLTELSEIRLADPKRLFDGLLTYVKARAADPATAKFTAFLHQLRQWRRTAGCCCVAELVQQIYLDTGYPDFVRAAMPGEYGAENLDQFLQLAWQFSADSRCDLSHFLAYLDLMDEQSGSISGVHSGAGKGVRIMTVHASKGLEFPVVVLANMGRKVNLQDIRGDILIDRDLLVGLRDVDPASLVKEDTLPFVAIAKSIRDKTVAEELRLLYVAMTRAKEKLVMVGSAKLVSLVKDLQRIGSGRPLTPTQVAERDNPVAWMGAAMASAGAGFDAVLKALESPEETRVQCGPFEITAYPSAAQTRWTVEGEFWGKVNPAIAERLMAMVQGKEIAVSPASQEAVAPIIDRVAWEYPLRGEVSLPTSVSVTELIEPREKTSISTNWNRVSVLTPERQSVLPGLATLEAIQRGHAWHGFLEHLDLHRPLGEESLGEQVREMVAGNILTAMQARLINLSHVARFFGTQPGKIMLEHRDCLHRELPFTYSLPAREFPEGARPGESDEPVLIQGVIDCLVPTKNGFVIIDYKTNNIQAGEVDRMVEHYRIQLELYSKAMGEILRARVASAWLYFTVPHAAVQVV